MDEFYKKIFGEEWKIWESYCNISNIACKNKKEKRIWIKKLEKNFKFNQKEIIQDGEDLYCDGELLQKGEEKPIGETEKWIKIKDKNTQEYIFKYSRLDSNNIKVASDFNWKESGIVNCLVAFLKTERQ